MTDKGKYYDRVEGDNITVVSQCVHDKLYSWVLSVGDTITIHGPEEDYDPTLDHCIKD
jgi:hypothetical protein